MSDPLADRPVRDQHGTPLPDDPGPTDLQESQIDEALAALPGWRRAGTRVTRQIPVPRDSRAALEEGIANVVEDESRIVLDDSGEGLTIVLGGGKGGVRPADLEAAARIDTVLSGSGIDRGGQAENG
jgi:hypothetical protein